MEERWIRFILAFYNKKIRESFKEILPVYRLFVSFEEFSRYILYKIEEKTTLTEKEKTFIKQAIRDIYYSAPKEVGLPVVESFELEDIRAIKMAEELSDFYLGKFFQGDKKLRKEVINWLTDYYLREGNPLGRGTKGVKEFLNKFGKFLKVKSEYKARQIIETTVQFIKSASWINTMRRYRIKYYRWDAVGDRLTCRACRSMDGRIIKVEEGFQEIQKIMNNPLALPKVRPIISKPFYGPTSSAPVKSPPAHPSCRCRIAVHTEEREITTIERPPGVFQNTAQKELEERFSALTPQERANKLRIIQQDSAWGRPPEKPKDREIKRFLGEYVKKHFEKHGKEVGANNVEEYKAMAYEVLSKPEKVFVSLHKYGEKETTYWAIFKKNTMVIVSEDNYTILSMYKMTPEKWIEEEKKRAEKWNGEAGFIELR